MSKLKDKLLELGYVLYFTTSSVIPTCAIKWVLGYEINLTIEDNYTKIKDYELTFDGRFSIKEETDISDIRYACEIMKKDLEELKKYEKK